MRYSTAPKRPSEKSAKLAERMKKMRHRYGETQLQFADRYGVYWQTYARWENWGPPNTEIHHAYVDNKLTKLGRELAAQRKVKANESA